MKFDFLSQAAKFLQERKEYKRWLAAFMCLALAVTFGTVGALKMYGQAMTHQVKVLECQYEVHEHTEDCYEKNEDGEPTGDPVCGYADYVIHVHNDDCYDENQNLVCPLEEIEKHEHDDDCYEKKEVLVCEENESESADGHTHTEACYTEVKGELICEVSDDGGHTHDDGCYSETLVCDQEEHRHDDSCYKKELVCDNEEEDHEHDDGCYDETLDCDKDEHEHGGDCYSKELTCTEEEGSGHEHTDDCYKTEKELTCEEGESESADGHTHDDDCYETEEVLTCGKLELHTHKEALVEDGGCYDESAFDEDGQFIEGSRPVCGIPQLEEHVHTAECFKTVELTDEEVAALNNGATLHIHSEACYDEEGNLICALGEEDNKEHEHDMHCYDSEGVLVCGHEDAKDHEHDADCYDEKGSLICGHEGVKDHVHGADCYDQEGNLVCEYNVPEDHEHMEACYDEEGNLICGYETPTVYDNSKTFACDDYIIVARYNEDAQIPEEAQLLVEQITPETDEEHYAQREAEYQETMKDDTASMRALLKIGFYLDTEDGEKIEVEPETPVEISIQFLDEDGLTEGSPITIVHFADEGTEKLDGSEAKDSSTTFEMRSFSEIAIGYGTKETVKINENGTLHISDDFECNADPFHIVFHVEGDAKSKDGTPIIVALPDAETAEDGSVLLDTEEDGDEATLPETEETGESVQPATDASLENNGTETEEGTTGSVENDAPENEDEKNGEDAAVQLSFHVKSLDDDPEMREALMNYLGESTESVSRNILHTISFYMAYGDVELDLSDCVVTAGITLGTASPEEGEESLPGNDSENEEKTADDETVEDAEMTDTMSDDLETDGEEQKNIKAASVPSPDTAVVNEITENSEEVQTFKDILADDDAETEISVMAIGISETGQMKKLASMSLGEKDQMDVSLDSGIMALADESTANPTFIVQYYAYTQIMATENPGGNAEAIKIIDTVKNGQDGVLGGAQLPSNSTMPATRNMYVAPATDGPYTAGWPVYNPVYISKDSIDSLTKIYTTDLYEFKEAAGGLEHINKFAKDGLNYDLYEVWVSDKSKADSLNKSDWTVYSGDDTKKLVFRNNNVAVEGEITVQITKDTVIRLVGRSNNEVNKNYPARFFDYDFTDGTAAHVLKGINHPSNYEKDNAGNVITPRYGFGNNSSGATGLKDDQLNGYNINIARSPAKTIIEKCSFGLVNSQLSSAGYPEIKANAPDLFNPENQSVNGKTEISGRSLNFNRDGDTYTLTSVVGSEKYAQNLEQFQKRPDKAYGTDDQIWTNQFWPMDNAETFGDTKNGHDPKFGTDAQHKAEATKGLAVSDDGKEHNSFFGMAFEVEFELTDDYVGPLNYYFFGDDDMWVFLEYPDKSTKLICDIGGVHQAAGEYVDLWNYIQKPEDNIENNKNVVGSGTAEDRVNPKYKLKFFYTERGASGSTCWMQFTLPSVNAVPVIDYTGNVKSTLELGKTVEGEETDELFNFTITFSGTASNIANNDYPYQILDKDENVLKSGDIRSGEKFQLGNKQTIKVFNLPDNTKYVIEEDKYAGYEPGLGDENTSGTITADKTVEGNIDWKKDDKVDYINHQVPFELPETGGPGPIWYMIASAFFTILGAGLMYNKKFRERRV